MYTGKCHCGNVSLTIPFLSKTATRCNCSICNRYATIWGYFSQQEVKVVIGEHGVSSYCHGDKTVNFMSCNHCNCITHYISTNLEEDDRLAINYRMFNAELLKDIEIRYFDGATSWKMVDKSL